MVLQGQRLQQALAITGAVAWILQGYDQALMNGLLTLPSFYHQFQSINTSTPELAARNSLLQGTTVALYEVGAAAGALGCFVVGDLFGRKKTTFGAAIVVLIGVVLQATSFQLAQLILARIWTGLGVGAFTATIPTWVGESSEANHRGWLIMLEGCFAIFGVMFVGWLELGFYFVPGENQVSFRFPIAFQAVFPIFIMCAIPFLPESPRWLLAKDRHAEARQVLARLEGENEDSETISARLQVIQNSLILEQSGHTKNPFVLNSNRYLHRTLLAVGINIMAQMSGVNVITFYSNTIFEEYLHFGSVLSRIISSCLQTWQFLCATGAVFLIDRFGRRNLLIMAAALLMVANAGLAGLQSHAGDSSTIAGCTLIFYFLALFAFPVGLFLIPFLYASEVAPLQIRSRVSAMSSASNWLCNFVVSEITPVGFDNIGWKYYLVYVCTNAFSVVMFYLFVPETKDRSLEDIDALFLQTGTAFQVVGLAESMPPGFAEEHDISAKAGVDQVEKVEEA